MATGTEMLLKSMGLGDAMKAVKDLVESGALTKILTFADSVDAMRAKIEELGRIITNGQHAKSCPHCGGAIERPAVVDT